MKSRDRKECVVCERTKRIGLFAKDPEREFYWVRGRPRGPCIECWRKGALVRDKEQSRVRAVAR